MAANLIPLGLSLIGTVADYINRPKFKGTEPPKDLMLSDQDIAMMEQEGMSKLQTSASKQVEDIKGFGAAGRLPEGAVLSGIGETAEGVAEGHSKLKPRLKALQKRSEMQYYGLKNQYDMQKFGVEMGFHDRNMGNLGSLSKIAMLYSSGLLDRIKQPRGN